MTVSHAPVPVQLFRLLGPECLGVPSRAVVDARVRDDGLLDEARGRWEDPFLLQERVDVLLRLAHAGSPLARLWPLS